MFYPEASDQKSLLSGIERFDSDKPGVLFFDGNPATNQKARQIGEIDKQNAGDEPAEHFAITGLNDGVAIIGSGTPGEDVHIIYDDGNEAGLYDRASCFHKAFNPIAVSYKGELYVIGYNTIEPDVMYFRSDPVKGRLTEPVSVEETAKRSRYMGIATIALVVGIAMLLMAGRRRK